MKLAKLSLAALIALGVSSSLSAEPLEDVIKNVDVSGYLRYRYTSTTETTKKDGTKDVSPTEAAHNFKSVINFKSAIDDHFFTKFGLQYSSTDVSGVGEVYGTKTDTKTDTTGITNTGDNFKVRNAFLGYKIGNTTALAGRQSVNSFFTDDMLGTGLEVMNSDIAGLTLTAFAFDDLESDSDIGTAAKTDEKDAKIVYNTGAVGKTIYTYQHNLFGIAAAGSYDPINFQLSAAKLKGVANLFAVEVGGEFGIFSLKAQAGVSALNKNFKNQPINTLGDDDKLSNHYSEVANGHIYGLEAGLNLAGFEGSLGLVNFGTKQDKISLVTIEDKGGFISAGEQTPFNYNAFAGKNNFAYLTGGYTIDKVTLGGDVVYGVAKTALDTDKTLKTEYSHTKTKSFEWVARLEYAYSKKLNFSTYYSQLKTKDSEYTDSNKKTTDTDTTNNQYRFEAKYSF